MPDRRRDPRLAGPGRPWPGGRDRRRYGPGLEPLERRLNRSLAFNFAIGVGAHDLAATAVAIDSAGDAYVTGTILGTADFDPGPGTTALSTAGTYDVYVAKYSPAGALVWARSMPGRANGSNLPTGQGRGLAVDGSGNVYVTGNYSGTVDFDPGPSAHTLSSPGRSDIFVAKLDAAGNYAWAVDVAGTAGDFDSGNAVAIDAAGNVAIAGTFAESATFGATTLVAGGSSDAFVAKLDGAGGFLWARDAHGSAGANGVGSGIAVDASGNLAVTGFFTNTANFNAGSGTTNLNAAGLRDAFVWKLDGSGGLLWADRIGGADFDQGAAVAFDASGDVVTTGAFAGTVDFDPGPGVANLTSGGDYSAYISKLDASGNLLWARALTISAGAATGEGIAVDGSGNVITTGWFANTVDFDPGPGTVNLTSTGGYDVYVSELDASGNYVNAVQAGGTNFDAALGLAINPSGSLAIVGTYNGPASFGGINLATIDQQNIFVAGLISSTNLLPRPAPPTLLAASDSGSSRSDDITSFTSLGFDVGPVNAAYTVQLFRDGTPVGTRQGPGTIIDAGPIGQGVHSYSERLTDGTGHVSPLSLALSVTVDTTPPAPPAAPTILAADDSGAKGDGITNVRQPHLTGNTEPGATVQLIGGNGDIVATATADADGSYTLALPNVIADGLYTFRVQAVDVAGNIGNPGKALSLTIDTTPPAPPATPTILAADDSGVKGDGITNVRQPHLTGSTEPGATVQLLDGGGKVIGSATADANGAFSVAPSLAMADGAYALSARAIDAAGNVGNASGTVPLTIDTTPPAPPATPTILAADDSGTQGDGITNVRQPHLSGNTEPGATVQLLDGGGKVIGSATADANGAFSVAPSLAMADGAYALSARAVDAAGNVGNASGTVPLTIDTTPPAPPATPNLLAADDSGTLGDNITNLTQPHLTVNAEPGAFVQLFDASDNYVGWATGFSGGMYTISIASPLADGPYTLRARAIDAAGNIGAFGNALKLTIDTTPPAPPATPNLLAADDSGVKGDGITNVRQPHLSGNTEPGATVQLLDGGGKVIGSATADANGAFSVAPSLAMADGAYALSARAIDAAGNVGNASGTVPLTIDTTPPAPPAAPTILAADDSGTQGDGITNVRQPRVKGTTTPGWGVDLLDGTGRVLGTTTAAADGSYTVRPAGLLAGGPILLSVRVRNFVGNASQPGPVLPLKILATTAADFYGDGHSDLAIFRTSTAQWFISGPAGKSQAFSFGAPNRDIPVSADFDGDGKVDPAVFDPATATWYILGSSRGPYAIQFGPAGSIPVPADYEGNGKVDPAVFDPASATWYVLGSSHGPYARQFGPAGSMPVPGDYDGDGRADLAVYQMSTGQWYISGSSTGNRALQFGGPGDSPIPADYDGDGKVDPAVFDNATATWYILQSSGGGIARQFGWPGQDSPMTLSTASRAAGTSTPQALRLASASPIFSRATASPGLGLIVVPAAGAASPTLASILLPPSRSGRASRAVNAVDSALAQLDALGRGALGRP